MKKLLDFDSVLIEPQFSEVRSRKDVNISTDFLGMKLSLPVLNSNMDTVASPDLCKALAEYGTIGTLHRFWPIDENVQAFKDSIHNGIKPIVSIGIAPMEFNRAEELFEAGAKVFILDVAHAANVSVVEFYNELIKEFPIAKFIVGDFGSGQEIDEFLRRVNKAPDALKVGIGIGCFGKGTRVLMSNGSYKNIEDIKLHDRVINKDGNPVEVVGTTFSGYKTVQKYKNNLFYDYSYATPEHKHWIGDFSTSHSIAHAPALSLVLNKPTRLGESKIGWNVLQDYKATTLFMPQNIKFELPNSFKINLNDFAFSRRNMHEKIEYKDIFPSYELGYIFGTFLGDGCARISYSTRMHKGIESRNTTCDNFWYFGKGELDIVEKLQNCLNSVFSLPSHIQETHNLYKLRCSNAALTRLLYEFGKRKEKHLPWKYMCSNKEYLKGLYDGLMDSDGNFSKDGRHGFTNTSRQLTELFMFVAYMINGYYPSCETHITPPNDRVKVYSTAFICRTRKSTDRLFVQSGQINRVWSLEPIDLAVPTYDIQVADDTHSFIANNAIVHNSVCKTRNVTGVGNTALSCLLDINGKYEMPIILDGGVSEIGDISKALVAGADIVMSGSMFAGTTESAGEIIGSGCRKVYRGSASLPSYKIQGKEAPWRAPEGTSITVDLKGPVVDVLNNISGGLKSACSYVGAFNLDEFKAKATFQYK